MRFTKLINAPEETDQRSAISEQDQVLLCGVQTTQMTTQPVTSDSKNVTRDATTQNRMFTKPKKSLLLLLCDLLSMSSIRLAVPGT